MRVFSVLKTKTLQDLVSLPAVKLEEKMEELKPTKPQGKKEKEKQEKKNPFPSKHAMLTIMHGMLEGRTIKDLLDMYPQKSLLLMCEDIDDLSSYSEKEKDALKKNDLMKAILNNVNMFGLNHLFQLLNVEELKAIVKDLNLTVDSSSVDILIDSIVEKKSYRRPKSKTRAVSPSKKKPDIEKGITKVDLNQWYNRDELEDWIRKIKEGDDELKEVKVTGKKAQLIDRILKILDGDIKGTEKKKGGKKKRSRSKSVSREEKSGEEKETKKSGDEKETKKRKPNEKTNDEE